MLDVRSCANDDDCLLGETCSFGVCEIAGCTNGFKDGENGCYCDGITCGNGCYAGTGLCCSGVWNENLDSCQYDVSKIETLVEGSDDLEAINLLNSATNNIGNGNVMKGKTQAMLAKLKVESINNSALVEVYQKAKTAYDLKDYEGAQELIIENQNQETGIGLEVIIIIAIIVIIGLVIWFKLMKPGKFEQEH